MRFVNYVEVHNAGMPVRIVFLPGVPSRDIKEKKNYCEENLDWLRKLLTYEPREPVAEKARELGVGELYGFRFSRRQRENRYLGVLVYGCAERPLLDRSPSGTGSSAHLAYLYYKGLARPGDVFEFESAVGTVFTGRIAGEVVVEGKKGVVPEISTVTRACYITGYNTAILEPDDPLEEGFPPLPV